MKPSLIVQPARQKAGTLYGYSNGLLVPFEVIRATPRTRVNQNGLIETIGNNIAAFDYGAGSCPAFNPWESRANLVQRSEEFNDAYWSKAELSVDTNAATAPDGSTTADKIIPSTNNTTKSFSRGSVFVADGTPHTWSIYVKADGYRYVVFGEGTIADNSLTFDAQDGVYTQNGAAPFYTSLLTPENMGNGWYRIGYTTDLASTFYDNFTFFVTNSPTGSADTFVGDGVSGVLIWGAQIEAGDSASPYIPTTSSAVTRNAEVIRNTSATAYIGQTEGAIAQRIIVTDSSDVRPILDVHDGTTSDRIFIYMDGMDLTVQMSVGGILQGTVVAESLTAGQHSYCFTYDAFVIKLYVDGVLVNEVPVVSVPVCDSFNIGSDLTEVFFYNGHLFEPVFYTSVPSNQQCINLSNL